MVHATRPMVGVLTNHPLFNPFAVLFLLFKLLYMNRLRVLFRASRGKFFRQFSIIKCITLKLNLLVFCLKLINCNFL